jgi:hypothetical protein
MTLCQKTLRGVAIFVEILIFFVTPDFSRGRWSKKMGSFGVSQKTSFSLYPNLGVTVEVNGIRRMGREKEPNYNRLIWVRLGSKKERNDVLDAAKNWQKAQRGR